MLGLAALVAGAADNLPQRGAQPVPVLEVKKLARQFVDLWDASKDLPSEQRVARFKTDIAVRFPEFYGVERYAGAVTEAEQDKRIANAIEKFGPLREAYLAKPWDAQSDSKTKSWLAKIADMIRSGDYPNLWTDIAYTLFADNEYVYLMKVLLSNPEIRSRVLFGSDFPLISPDRWLKDFEELPMKDEVRPLVLKENAVRALGLADA